jgi:hypothetical protein
MSPGMSRMFCNFKKRSVHQKVEDKSVPFQKMESDYEFVSDISVQQDQCLFKCLHISKQATWQFRFSVIFILSSLL